MTTKLVSLHPGDVLEITVKRPGDGEVLTDVYAPVRAMEDADIVMQTGVERFEPSAVRYRIRGRTPESKTWLVLREFVANPNDPQQDWVQTLTQQTEHLTAYTDVVIERCAVSPWERVD